MADAKGETTGEGETDNLFKYGVYRRMLADWFDEPPESAINKEYLVKIAKLTKEATMPGGGPGGYPARVRTAAQRALFNNLDKAESLALAVDAAIQGCRQDGWKESQIKMKQVRNAIKAVLVKASAKDIPSDGLTLREDVSDAYAINSKTTRILELAKHQHEY